SFDLSSMRAGSRSGLRPPVPLRLAGARLEIPGGLDVELVPELLEDGGDLIAAPAVRQVDQAPARVEQWREGLELEDELIGLEILEPAEPQDDIEPGSPGTDQVLDLVGQPRPAPGQDVVEVVAVDLEEGASRQWREGRLRLSREVG